MKVRLYFINLDDCVERWSEFKDIIEPVCDEMGYELHRLAAVDTRSNIMRCEEYGLSLNPVGILAESYFSVGNGAVGCYLSHYLIWKDMIDSEVDYGFAIEDDANVDDLKALLRSQPLAELCDGHDLVQVNNRELTLHCSLFPDDKDTLSSGFDGTESFLITNTGANKLFNLTHNHTCFKDVVNPTPSHIWLNQPGLKGLDRKKVTTELFPLLKDEAFDWSCTSSICAAVDKFIGMCSSPGLGDDVRLNIGCVPTINLNDTESDIFSGTKGYWQMNNSEFIQSILSRKYKKWLKHRDVMHDFDITPGGDSIVVTCVIRDEAQLLLSFIKHYERMGATHFIFIDNNSIDDSIDIIERDVSVELRIVRTEDSYGESEFGMTWVHEELLDYCKDVWCVVVDVDEYIVLRNHDDLNQYRSYMSERDLNVSQMLLVDMYPESLDKQYTGDPFDHSCYHDMFTNNGTIFTDTGPDGCTIVKGGVRERVFGEGEAGNSSCCLVKKSFFKYDFYETHSVSVGMHWLLPYEFTDWTFDKWDQYDGCIRYDDVQLIAHFKFVKTDLQQYFKSRVTRDEDWNGSEEYKKYISNFPVTFIDYEHSVKYNTSKPFLFGYTVDRISIIT